MSQNSLCDCEYSNGETLTSKHSKKETLTTKHSIGETSTTKQCIALKTDGKRCSRNARHNLLYCGTHINKTNTHSINISRIAVVAEELDGIVYFRDSSGNLYDAENIHFDLKPHIILSDK